MVAVKRGQIIMLLVKLQKVHSDWRSLQCECSYSCRLLILELTSHIHAVYGSVCDVSRPACMAPIYAVKAPRLHMIYTSIGKELHSTLYKNVIETATTLGSFRSRVHSSRYNRSHCLRVPPL